MAKFRMVYTEFWEDPKVTEEMTPEDKYFYLYLLTNPNTRQIGVYTITRKKMAFDLGYSIESVNSLIDRFIKHHKIIAYNDETREICLLNWGKYNLNRGGKPVIDLIKKELAEVEDISLLAHIYPHIEKEDIKKEFARYVVRQVDDSSHDTNDDTSNESNYQEPNNTNGSHDTSHDSSTISRQEKEVEEEKEEYKEEQLQEDINNNLDSSGCDVLNDPDFKEILNFYRENIQKGVTDTPFNYELLQQFFEEWGKELMLANLKLTAKKEAGIPFIEAVFDNWKKAGVKTVDDARRYNEELQNKRRGYNNKKEIVPDWFENRKKKKQKETLVSDKDINQILKDFQTKKSG